MTPTTDSDLPLLGQSLNRLRDIIHQRNLDAGWWTDLHTGADLRHTTPGPKRNVPEMLALVHSEVSEALEGYRKGLQDDKLPHRPMAEVEIADTIIRLMDLAGGLGYDIGGALVEKLEYNASRADHKPENRRQPGGKSI
jgi:hypothetical protein